jgi:hypothetical protein
MLIIMLITKITSFNICRQRNATTWFEIIFFALYMFQCSNINNVTLAWNVHHDNNLWAIFWLCSLHRFKFKSSKGIWSIWRMKCRCVFFRQLWNFCDSRVICNMKYLCASFKTNCSSSMGNNAIIDCSSRIQNFLKVVAIFVVMHTRAFMT